MFARGTQFESNRFYGFGNDTPDHDVSNTLVRRDEVVLYPSFNYAAGSHSFISFGPVFKWNNPHVEEGSPADVVEPFGSTESVSQLGLHFEAFLNTAGLSGLPRNGFVVNVGATSYPAMQDITEPFHEANVMAATYLRFGLTVLALRVGGKHVWGDVFPLHEAAFLGGFNSVRGYRWNRYAGNAAAFGGADFRIPITRAVLFTRGDLGIHFLGDAGRVWTRDAITNDLASAGDWHIGYGGGVWFETIGQLLTLSYARGEDEGRFYFKLGKPF